MSIRDDLMDDFVDYQIYGIMSERLRRELNKNQNKKEVKPWKLVQMILSTILS